LYRNPYHTHTKKELIFVLFYLHTYHNGCRL